MNLRRRFGLGKRRGYPFYVEPFPKSRKIVFDDKKYPLGWIKIKMVK